MIKVGKYEVKEKDLIYGIAILGFLTYFIFKVTLIPIVAGTIFIVGVIYESWINIRENGWKKELKEIMTSIFFAITIWVVFTFILGTQSPFNAVVSCSMLPNLERGDVIILSGTNNNIPEINLEKWEWEIAKKEIHNTCGFCIGENQRLIPCQIDPVKNEQTYGEIVNYDCGICVQKYDNGTQREIACTQGIKIKDKYFAVKNYSRDILVYRPNKEDVFSRIGDIIHRGMIAIKVGDQKYYLIKGDNNPILDVQMGIFKEGKYLTNEPPTSEQIIGRELFRIPAIGYIKLVISGQLITPENCKYRVSYR